LNFQKGCDMMHKKRVKNTKKAGSSRELERKKPALERIPTISKEACEKIVDEIFARFLTAETISKADTECVVKALQAFDSTNVRNKAIEVLKMTARSEGKKGVLRYAKSFSAVAAVLDQ